MVNPGVDAYTKPSNQWKILCKTQKNDNLPKIKRIINHVGPGFYILLARVVNSPSSLLSVTPLQQALNILRASLRYIRTSISV